MAILCVNVDHIATIRQARRAQEPDPVVAAAIAELAGASGITIHLREDRRHIQERDLKILREVVKTKLNLEMAAADEMVNIALSVKPDQVTLVPERREELTTEGGLDVENLRDRIAKVVALLKEGRIHTSLFIDPDPVQIKASHRVGALAVELHTGRYAEAKGEAQVAELEKIINAAKLAKRVGLNVYAGHGLDYWNVGRIAAVPDIEELNIGFSIVARAALVGMGQAVKEMLAAMGGG